MPQFLPQQGMHVVKDLQILPRAQLPPVVI